MCLSETSRQDSIPERNQLDFAGRILDNVHGFIYYTKAEEKIINHLLFKRLQSIKQLSIANWVFPGSEHTRFIHSLGVMYVADKIACQLKLSTNDRKIVRLAGLLHDIGHYPLSHVCEFPYKMNPAAFPKRLQPSSGKKPTTVATPMVSLTSTVPSKTTRSWLLPYSQTLVERKENTITSNYTVKANLTPGDWSGTVSFVCSVSEN